MPGKDLRACQGCGSSDRELLLDMGFQPPPEGSGTKYNYPLRLVICCDCALVQLDYAVDPGELFPADHPYATGNSAALREHYLDLAQRLSWGLLVGDVVVDIGANDGTFLRSFSGAIGERHELRLVAVEPTRQILKPAAYGNRAPLHVYQEPWTRDLARRLRAEHGPAKVITAMNVLAHVPDVHDFLDGVAELLDEDGMFLTENHDLYSVIDGLQVDTVYHEHLRYYSAATLTILLERHGLRTERIEPVPTHGGSFRVTARRVRGNFPARARVAATALRALLYQLTVQKRNTVYGIGAATRATPLIHYAGIEQFIDRICEVSTSDKIGSKMPGTQIPVVDEVELLENQPAYALLLNWHMAGYVVPKLRERGYLGKFIVPLPEPKVLDD